MTDEFYSGGCQCGAVRFRLNGKPRSVSICHCRMCQKAFGGLYAPLADADEDKVVWTRGRAKYFQSSNHVKRGFCENCGTPLTYEAVDGVGLAVGAFDEPERLAPVVQFGTEAKVAYVDHLHELPERHTMDDIESAPFLADLVSHQHPDHDTTGWVARQEAEEQHWRPREEGV